MSDEAEGKARAEEIEADVAAADARRAEEERGKAEQEAEAAKKKAEKLSRKEREANEKAEQEAREAAEARAKAEQVKAARAKTGPAGVGGDTVTSPGAGDQPEGWAAKAGTRSGAASAFGDFSATSGPAAALEDQRPEVLIGAAFAGAFLFAKLIKRLGN